MQVYFILCFEICLVLLHSDIPIMGVTLRAKKYPLPKICSDSNPGGYVVGYEHIQYIEGSSPSFSWDCNKLICLYPPWEHRKLKIS